MIPRQRALPRWLRRDLARLTRYCPVGKPVVVECAHLSFWADCIDNGDHFLIRMDLARLDAASGHELIAHEWAHARAWDKSRIDHGSAWGIEYARCYRVLIDGWRPKR